MQRRKNIIVKVKLLSVQCGSCPIQAINKGNYACCVYIILGRVYLKKG